MELVEGSTFHGKYRLDARIGSGATKIVWKARDVVQERDVALKLIEPEQLRTSSQFQLYPPDLEALALREAQLLTSIGKHPHVAEIYDANLDPATQRFFIAEEYVPGITLEERLRQLPLGRERTRETIRYARQLLKGIQHLDARGIVHGDLTLKNILVSENHVTITDFGQAQSVGMQEKFGSTLIYQSPEQVAHAPAMRETNMWQFGIVLYYALTNRFPFISQGFDQASPQDRHVLREELKNHILQKLLPPHGVPKGPGRLITNCLRKDPDQRLTPKQAYTLLSPWRPLWASLIGVALAGATALLADRPAAQLSRLTGDGSRVFYTTHARPECVRDMDGTFRGDLPFMDAKTPVHSCALSPSGTKIAYTTKERDRETLRVIDVHTEQTYDIATAQNIYSFAWGRGDRLAAICTTTSPVPATSLITIENGRRTEQDARLAHVQWHPSGSYLSLMSDGGVFGFVEPGKPERQAHEYPLARSHQWISKGLLLHRTTDGPGVWLYNGAQDSAALHTDITEKRLLEGAVAKLGEFNDRSGIWYLEHNILHLVHYNGTNALCDFSNLSPHSGKGIVDVIEGNNCHNLFVLARLRDWDGSGNMDGPDTELFRIQFTPQKENDWDYRVDRVTTFTGTQGIRQAFYTR